MSVVALLLFPLDTKGKSKDTTTDSTYFRNEQIITVGFKPFEIRQIKIGMTMFVFKLIGDRGSSWTSSLLF